MQKRERHVLRAECRRAHPLAFAAVAVLLGATTACTTPADPEPIAAIQIVPASDSLEVGATAAPFVVSMQDLAGRQIVGRRVTWSSQNTAVATVDEDGRVSGLTPGQSIITATAEGKSATAFIKVLIPIFAVSMVPESLSVPLTQPRGLTVLVLGPQGEALIGRQVIFATANASVATVSPIGLVTGVSVGNTTVTATAGTKTAASRVFVTPEPVAAVRIEPESTTQTVQVSNSLTLTAVCLNATGSVLPGRTVTWTSSNPTIVSVDDGTVTGLKTGSATITATCEGRIDTVLIQVIP
jgi:uncharacterized protein YjdB